MRYKDEANQSLSKGLAILEHLALTQAELGVRELARRLEMSPSVVQRLMSTLRGRGFVEQNPANLRYRLGHRTFEVGQSYLSQEHLSEIAFAELRELARVNSMSAFLGVMRSASVIYLLSLPSMPIAVNTQPGSRTYLHTTALGKVLLAGLSDHQLRDLMPRLELPRLQPATIADPDDLLAEIGRVRERGFAISDEENLPGIYSVGAAIADKHSVLAGVSLSAPRSMLTAVEMEKMTLSIVAAAQRLSNRVAAGGGELRVTSRWGAGAADA